MKVLIDLDSWLVTRVFEPIAWKIELHTGLNCFALAKFSLFLGLAAGVISSFPERAFLGKAVSILIASAAILIGTVFLRNMERRHLQSPQLQNEMKPHWQVRFIYLFFPLADYLSSLQEDFASNRLIVALISSIFMISFVYFASCNTLPPGSRNESRITKKMIIAPV